MGTIYKIIAILGGLSMFLYGMRVMGDGLKSSSGSSMQKLLSKATAKPFLSFLLGVFVTCAIQSSTAAIVLTVGLVGAGYLSFRQSVSIVLGANVGTAITAQVIRLMDLEAGENSLLYFFKADNLAPLALILGIVLIMFIKTRNANTTGSVFCGFGILFMGLIYMSSAVDSFKDPLGALLTSFENNYFLGFLTGVGVTGVIQSSSAVIGILQSVASSVGVTFSSVFTVIIGVNIGDCLTTFLVSRIGAKPNQIRTTLVHIIYNIFAAILIILFVLIGRLTGLLSDNIFLSTLYSGGVANLHGLFRLVPAILLLPLSGFFAAIAEKIVPDKPRDKEDLKAEELMKSLDPHLNLSPAVALSQVKTTIANMSELSRHNVTAARQQIFSGFDPARAERIAEREHLLDQMTDACSQYLLSLTPNMHLERDFNNQNFLLKVVTCFERIGDLAINLTDNEESLRESGSSFSKAALQELDVVFSAVDANLTLVEKAFSDTASDCARDVEPLEEVIDDLIEHLKAKHVERMTKGYCEISAGIAFQNMLSNLERVSDQCSDIAIYLLEQSKPEISGREHSYVYYLHNHSDARYIETFNTAKNTYFSMLESADE